MMRSSKAIGVLAAAAFSVVGVHAASADIITQWAFNATVGAPDNSPAPTTGSGTAVSLGMTNNYSYAGGEGPGSVTNDDVTQPNTSGTPPSNEYAWRIRGNSNKKNAGAGLANGWNNSAPNYTQGAEFVESTAGYTNLNLSFDWYDTTQGVANMQIQYTLDASNASPTWVDVGSDYVFSPANNFYGATTPNISVSIPGVGGSDFAVQLVSVKPVATDSNYSSTNGDGNYASAAGGDYNNSSGNWSFNNITISGTAVPEPASASLLGLAGLGLLRRRRGN
ncbi:MAG: PEP-CTERM sorting domain-containing protein [Tepidisphaeraceae bacterium]